MRSRAVAAAMAVAAVGALLAGCGQTKPQGGATAHGCGVNPGDAPCPFADPSLPLEERISNLLAVLTPEEKIQWLFSRQNAVPRLGIPYSVTASEGLHGLAWAGDGQLTATQFPQAFGLAESWDPEVMRTVGATTGHEARVYNIRGDRLVGLAVRAPMIDLGRHPLWGRTEESYGEDPYLASQLGKGMVAGLQGDDPTYLQAASTLKHFLANNNETTREASSSTIDERNLREYYLVPYFEALVTAKAQSFMTAYNAINGIPATVTPLLRDVVRREWGFDGMICTDARAVELMVTAHGYFSAMTDAMAAAVKAGEGMILSSDRDSLAAAYASGMLTVADMDDSLRGNLHMRFRLGDFDPPARVPYQQILATEEPWNDPAVWARALDVTRRTVVLLKNENDALPLDRRAVGSVAVIGPRADSVIRDWYGGLTPYAVTPRQGIVNKLGSSDVVRYAADDTDGAATAAAAASDVALVFVGNHPTCGDNPYPPWAFCASPYEGREAVDRKHLAIEPAQLELVQAVFAANPRTVVVLVSSFPQALGWIDDNIPAIVHIANSGQEIGTAIADVLFGDYNPGARTTMTWYRSETDIPDIGEYDIRKGLTYQYFGGSPLYPFGHGKSYTTFAYADLVVTAPALSPGENTSVSVDVTNTGPREGDEVVQLYVSYPDSRLVRPRQQLRGFRRIHLQAGETRTVTFTLAADSLTYWDTAVHRFALEGGSVDVQVGASSADIRLRRMLTTRP